MLVYQEHDTTNLTIIMQQCREGIISLKDSVIPFTPLEVNCCAFDETWDLIEHTKSLIESCEKHDSMLKQVKDSKVEIQNKSLGRTDNEQSEYQTPMQPSIPIVPQPLSSIYPPLSKVEPTPKMLQPPHI